MCTGAGLHGIHNRGKRLKKIQYKLNCGECCNRQGHKVWWEEPDRQNRAFWAWSLEALGQPTQKGNRFRWGCVEMKSMALTLVSLGRNPHPLRTLVTPDVWVCSHTGKFSHTRYVFYNSIWLWYSPELVQTPQVKGSAHKTSHFSCPVSGSRFPGYLELLLDLATNWGVPTTPSLSSFICYNNWQNSDKQVYQFLIG